MIKGAGMQRIRGEKARVTMPLPGQNQFEAEENNYIKEMKFMCGCTFLCL